MQNCNQNWTPYTQPMGTAPQMCPMGMTPQMQPMGMGPQMQSFGMPFQMNPMANMSEQQLEMMYPRSYHIIYPEISRNCDMMDMTYGFSHVPSQKELDKLVEDITVKIEGQVTLSIEQDSKKASDDRQQLGFGGRRVLRDLVGILLIRELLRRRRRPIYGFPYGGGFGPGYGGGFDF